MTGAAQLLRGGEARRPAAHNSHFPMRQRLRRLRRDPAFRPAAHRNRLLDPLDRHRVLIDAQNAGRFAGRRAKFAGEFREIVRGVQFRQRLFPPVAVDQIVPVRDDVAERAALMTERDAAVHAPRRLLLNFFVREI